jgi:hypothetical protein
VAGHKAWLRRLFGNEVCRAGPFRRVAPRGEALQYPHDGRLTGCRSHGTLNSITEPDVAETVRKRTEDIALPAESFARVVAFAISQPDEMGVNEILFRPTRQVL